MIFCKLVLGFQWESKITKSKVIEENHWTLIDMGGTLCQGGKDKVEEGSPRVKEGKDGKLVRGGMWD
jgi:hypothetical protein